MSSLSVKEAIDASEAGVVDGSYQLLQLQGDEVLKPCAQAPGNGLKVI